MVGIKKESIGFMKGKWNEISSTYNIRCDPGPGVGKVAVINILYYCSSCMEQLYLPWNKNEKVTNRKRFSMNKKCLNWSIF